MPADIVMVAPDAGGNVQPSLRIGHALGVCGHRVTVLGHERLRSAAAAAGLTFEPFVEARAWRPVHERPGTRTLLGWLALASDRGIGRDLQRIMRVGSPDLVVVDCMVPGALAVATRLGAPTAMIMHTVQRYWHDQWSLTSPMGWWLRFHRLHPARHRPALTVVTTHPDLDRGPAVLPDSVQVGPLLGRLGVPSGRNPELPVLVSFSTISYPDQQQVVQRVLDAVATLPVRAVVTNPTGLERLSLPSNVRIETFLPHEEVMPNVRAVICHGGHGTTMMALAHGLPVLVVPLTRHADHELVGRMVEEAGVGTMLPKHSDTAVLAAGITRILAVDPERIGRVQRALRSTDSAAVAARAIERLAGDGGDTRP